MTDQKTVEQKAFEYARSKEIIVNVAITDGIEIIKEYAFKAGHAEGRASRDFELAALREKLKVAEEALTKQRQFCTWLCEDSIKYPGTDAGSAAKSERHDIDKALTRFRAAKE